METGEPQAWDLQIANEDGILFWAQLQATVAQDGKTNEPVCYVVISDITERKRAEETLRDVNRQLAASLARAEELAVRSCVSSC
ncbi:MAG: PAS domain S-box protein [Planctomycetota bacterium]|nr:PAS domain S-box protein [Planctomycetota bacterium]